MKILRYLLFILLAFAALTLVLGLIMPREVMATAERDTAFSRVQVYETVNDLSSWPDWSPWVQRGPDMVLEHSPTTVGTGARLNWSSDEMGDGELAIRKNVENQRIVIDMINRGRPSTLDWTFSESPSGTLTRLHMHFKVPYPSNAFLLFTDIDQQIGNELDSKLRALGGYLRKSETVAVHDIQIEPLRLEGQHYLVLRQRIPLDNMTGFVAYEGDKLRQAAQQAGIEPKGPFTVFYYEWNEEEGIGEAAVALPVDHGVELAPYVAIQGPIGPAAATIMRGPYSQMGAHYFALDAYLNSNGLTATTPAIEEYRRGPAETSDSTAFVTHIIYPLAQ